MNFGAMPRYSIICTIDMRACVYEQFDERTTRVTGPRYVAADELRVKLEGAGKVGERYVGMVGIRDPYTIQNVDTVIAWARDKVRERFGEEGYQLHYTVYGRNGVMGELEPVKTPAHELCIILEVAAATQSLATAICGKARTSLMHAPYPGRIATAGNLRAARDGYHNDRQVGLIIERIHSIKNKPASGSE